LGRGGRGIVRGDHGRRGTQQSVGGVERLGQTGPLSIRERRDQIAGEPLRPIVEVLTRAPAVGSERHQPSARIIGIDLRADESLTLEAAQQPADVSGVEPGTVPQLAYRDARPPELEEQPRRTDRSSRAEERLVQHADALRPRTVEMTQDRLDGHSLTLVR
jgi:hypothetical protein